jgi:hypothetical protein
VKQKAWQLADHLAFATFGERSEHIGQWKAVRDRIISCTYHKVPQDLGDMDQVRLIAPLTDWPDSRATNAEALGPPAELIWSWIEIEVGIREGTVPLTEHEKEQLRRQWPVQFDIKLYGSMLFGRSITTVHGWILGQTVEIDVGPSSVLAPFLWGCPLVYCCNDEVVTAGTILAGSEKQEFVAARASNGDLISPGCLWYGWYLMPTA